VPWSSGEARRSSVSSRNRDRFRRFRPASKRQPLSSHAGRAFP
jgi:hypothetical protein